MSDADARDELARLLASGVKLSRLTLLTVACQHGRALATVYRVNGRDLIDLRTTQTASIGDGDDEQLVMIRRGAGRTIRSLEEYDDDTRADASTSCCSHTFTAGWLRAQIGATACRVVLRSDTP